MQSFRPRMARLNLVPKTQFHWDITRERSCQNIDLYLYMKLLRHRVKMFGGVFALARFIYSYRT